jgi:hypothetical protein
MIFNHLSLCPLSKNNGHCDEHARSRSYDQAILQPNSQYVKHMNSINEP